LAHLLQCCLVALCGGRALRALFKHLDGLLLGQNAVIANDPADGHELLLLLPLMVTLLLL
jgi:hypothetical protein